MATVDEHQQLNQAGASMRKEGVKGSAGGAPGIKHVVDQHNLLTFDGKSDFRFLHYGLRSERRKIIAIEGDVERAHGNFLLFDLLNHFAQALGDGYSATADSY